MQMPYLVHYLELFLQYIKHNDNDNTLFSQTVENKTMINRMLKENNQMKQLMFPIKTFPSRQNIHCFISK